MPFHQSSNRALAAIGACIVSMACGGGTEPSKPQLKIAVQNAKAQAPANVSFLVRADDSKGEPLAGLQIQNFTLLEDGQAISTFESKAAIKPKPGRFIVHTVLVLDLSGSILGSATLPGLKQAAKDFVTASVPAAGSPNSGEVDLGIWWFDGAASLHRLADFSTDRAALLAAIDAISPTLSTDNSTNLHGAVIEGVTIARTKVAAEQQRQSTGFVVLFTDGTDQAARQSEAAAINAVTANKAIGVYTIGLGGEIKDASLAKIGRSGFFSAKDVGELSGAFDKVAARIRASANSYYLVEYCSPKRSGSHTLTVEVTDADKVKGSASVPFSAAGFLGGCVITP